MPYRMVEGKRANLLHSACVHVRECARVHVRECACVCSRTHPSMQVKGYCQVTSLIALYIFTLGQDLSLNLKLPHLVRLAGQQTPRIILSASQVLRLQCMPPYPAFMYVLGYWILTFRLQQQALYWLSHLPNSKFTLTPNSPTRMDRSRSNPDLRTYWQLTSQWQL